MITYQKAPKQIPTVAFRDIRVDTRGYRLTSGEVLSTEDQSGILPANDNEDLDDGEESMDTWIPNGRILRAREEANGGVSESDIDLEWGAEAGSKVPPDIAELLTEENDTTRHTLLSSAWKQRNHLVAEDIADLASSKLKDFLSLDPKISNGDNEGSASKVKTGNAAKLLKGAGSSVVASEQDFELSDTDL